LAETVCTNIPSSLKALKELRQKRNSLLKFIYFLKTTGKGNGRRKQKYFNLFIYFSFEWKWLIKKEYILGKPQKSKDCTI